MIYTRSNIVDFLRALDDEISHRIDLIIIGGASLSLAYNFTNTTNDIDLYNRMTIELGDAVERARSRTQIAIPVSTTHIRAEILNMEQRLFTPAGLHGFKRLLILIPEKHDLALMKAARNEPKDVQDIEGLHAKDPLDPEILFNRFKNEVLAYNAGSDRFAKDKFLEMIESLFGEQMATDYELKL